MLAIRLLILLALILLVITLLGYAISRDRRWLTYAGLVFKGGVALTMLLMLVFVIQRLVMAV
jgi:hypothetical protein